MGKAANAAKGEAVDATEAAEKENRKSGKKARRAAEETTAEVPAVATSGERTKKRKRTDDVAEQDEVAKPPLAKGADAAAAPAGKNKKKRRKNKEGASSDAVSMPCTKDAAADEKRRTMQRELQQLVVRLRKEGKSEKEVNDAKFELKRQHGTFIQPDSHRAKKAKAYKEWVESEDYKKQEEETLKENREKKHELVVIPVTWRGRHDKLDVDGAAEDIKACVAQQGVDVWVDSRRQLKPGQKFAHWEHRGVMLRIEVGPEDMKAGVCQVCRATTPGEYKTVERKKVRLPPRGSRALLLQLKEWGLSQIDIEKRDGDSDDEAPDDAEASNATTEVTPSRTDNVEGNWAPAASTKAAQEKTKNKLKEKKKRS